jgi:G3E family GTPase
MRCALGALPHAVLRAKGFVRFDATPEIPQLIQVVGRRWSISAAPAVTRAEASVLVIIGAAEALAAADLTALEQACSGSAMSRDSIGE